MLRERDPETTASESPHVVFELRRDDRSAAVDVLARAFRDNPLNRAAIGAGASPERRLRCNAAGMRAALAVAEDRALVLGASGPAERAPPLAGVLVAAPPFAWPFPPPPFVQQLRGLFVQGLAVAGRWRRVFERLERVHPKDAHWYVAVLGVAPEAQGRGVGAALLAALLQRVDAAHLPAWLETDREENVRFYARAGFTVERDLEVLATRVFCMRRQPRAAEPSLALPARQAETSLALPPQPR